MSIMFLTRLSSFCDAMNVPELSLVIPCHNEEKNLQPLLSAIHARLDPLAFDYEIVITDDCSADNSWSILKQLTTSDPRLCIQRFKFNCGESAASWAGMQMSRGRHIATLDADLQNDPKDLPAMLKAIIGFGLPHRALLIGCAISSPVRTISDAGCTYRVFKRECIAHVKFFN